jgi:hypothetical protein
MAEEIAWLVEFPAQGGSGIEGCPGIERASWWIGDFGSYPYGPPRATHDSLQAMRFARKQDAEKAISVHADLRKRGAIATEHVWMDHTTPEDNPCGQALDELRAKVAALEREAEEKQQHG